MSSSSSLPLKKTKFFIYLFSRKWENGHRYMYPRVEAKKINPKQLQQQVRYDGRGPTPAGVVVFILRIYFFVKIFAYLLLPNQIFEN